MTCSANPTFRLFDARVGWDERSSDKLVALKSLEGLMLAPRPGSGVSPARVLPYFFPLRVSCAPGRCEWFLAPREKSQRLLRFIPCSRSTSDCGGQDPRRCSACEAPGNPPMCEKGFEPWGPPVVRARAVAAGCDGVLVADAGASAALLLDLAGNIRASIPVARPGAVAFTPWGELLVASRGRVFRYSLGGDLKGLVGHDLGVVIGLRAGYRPPTQHRADADDASEIWVAHYRRRGQLSLSLFNRAGKPARPVGPAALARSCAPVGIQSWDRAGFCWTDPRGLVAPCVDWNGCPALSEVRPFKLSAREQEGRLVIEPLDGSDPRTVWHRVRVIADVPPGTELRIEAATLDKPAATVTAWQQETALDFLVRQPPGRYLALRLALRGDGQLTPRVRQIRVDFPRATSADLLPAVYTEEPLAADFTERFSALLDAEIERLDDAIERFPATLHVTAAKDEHLQWLGSLIGLTFDEDWTPEARRAFITEAPDLFARRGTPYALLRVLEIASGEQPSLSEDRNSFGALLREGQSGAQFARLGETRLFSRKVGRFRLGQSTLGEARVRSHGNPDADPLQAVGYRFRVSFPPTRARSARDRKRLQELVEALKPAHTIATIRFADGGFVVGPRSSVGVDTALVGPPPSVLGHSTYLSRFTLLWPSARSRGPGFALDHPVVGVGTSL